LFFLFFVSIQLFILYFLASTKVFVVLFALMQMGNP
jgi:hypothetical protein